ncbi:MAG: NADAR family protein [Nocardioides sp.]|nr:NADAR family protein [Nocardioides sp.]
MDISSHEPSYLLFWDHRRTGDEPVGPWLLSQWWPLGFTLDGVAYAQAEQFMMAEKARIFGDEETRAAILATSSPQRAKELGRAVHGYDTGTWEQHRLEVVARGSTAKFGQDDEARAYLLGTGDRVLVEASPVDTIWGIGRAADDPAALDPARWRGRNLLGVALGRAREALADGSGS